MSVKRREFDSEYKAGAVQIVKDSGRSVASVARDLGISENTLWNWVSKDRHAQASDGGVSETEAEELVRLRREVVELRQQRDVLKRSVALWVNEAMGGKP
ncbi:MAG: transposase [Acidimicrobiia bacterium]